jgi:glycosyltransferase involved in cell wall biosynthesis/ADP-heptose:LPS heptosyltransferase/Tfp pilus assembly protein PilF
MTVKPPDKRAVSTAGLRRPVFSVIVPTFNQAAYLPAALESLQAQTFGDWEALIVNDGSTDGTAEVMRTFALNDSRLKTIHQENGGVASALNKGLSHANGEWICWLSSDDLFEPDKLEIHLEAIKNNPDTRFFHSHFYYLEDQTGLKSAPNPWHPIPEPELQVVTFFKAPYIHGNSIAIHKSVFNRVGQFDENSPCGQDFDMWLRISAIFPSRYIDRRTCVTRWHAGQTTNQFPEAGFFDSARACLTFLGSHRFEVLFPLFDLSASADICKAIQATINIALNQSAIMYRLGINTALLDRMGQWIREYCPQGVKPAVVDFIGKLLNTLESKNIPVKIRESLVRITQPNWQPSFFPSDLETDAMAFAKEIDQFGKHKQAEAIRKYVAQHAERRAKAPQAAIHSNLSCWKQLQDDGYFQNHHFYKGNYNHGEDDKIISRFTPLRRDMVVVVIGCGYGREVVHIAPHVRHVYGIDVNHSILDKAAGYLRNHGIGNFTPVLADAWKAEIPNAIDLVYSFVVFQHLTRDLVRDYIRGLTAKLSPKGKFICQFADLNDGTEDAKLEIYEPSVRWNKTEIETLIRDTGLSLYRMESQNLPELGDWHWAFFGSSGHLANTKVLMYYEGLHNSGRPYAGTNSAMVALAQTLNDLNGSVEIHLSGDYVNHEEWLGRTKILPSPDFGNRQAWLSEYATIVFATHLGWFKRFAKPKHQRWILHQHCWQIGPHELKRMDDFDRVIALTAKQKHAIARQGVPDGKISVMPNAINMTRFSLQPASRIPYSILFVGALVEHKGLDILIRALPKVRQVYPQAQIHVYGDAGLWHENNTYEEHVRTMVEENVVFHGARPNAEMPHIYSSHDILCLPSRMESFGLVTIEAQACGCIPVVHDVGGTSATLDDTRTGFLYAPNDATTLSACIIKAFKALDHSPAIRARAMEFINARFNLDKVAKSFLDSLQDSDSKVQSVTMTTTRDYETLGSDKNTASVSRTETRSELDSLIPAEIKKDALFEDIQRLSAESGIRHILEIGSSSGEGSTAAFVSGMHAGKDDARLYCLELSKPRFAELRSRYQKDDRVFCYRASSIPLENFPSEKEVADFYHQTPTALNNYPLERVLGWLRQDKDYLQRSQAGNRGIEQIKQQHGIGNFDLVLIDGSEFTGGAELDLVYGAGVIMLDDINGFKNYRNYHRLKKDPAYALEKENWQLRNGYAIFRRLKSNTSLPIHFFTIVLNGEPFIRYHLDIFKGLNFKWHWHIIEGVADLKSDTAWSLKNGGRISDRYHSKGLSVDGTTAFLDQVKKEYPDQVTLYRKTDGKIWNGKLEMVNAPIANLREPCLLWQIDADELWTVDQIQTVRAMFQAEPAKISAFFYCDFFVGPDLVTITRDTYGNHSRYEWLRVWRYLPGDFWQSHEPPRLVRPNSTGATVDVGTINPFSHAETESSGLVFQHYAYATEAQVRFKESYYGYKHAVRQWKKLQGERSFPITLKHYFAWVKDETQVAGIHSRGIKPLIALKAAAPFPNDCESSKYKGILWLRTDSIGDAVLGAGMLPVMRRYFPNSRITVVCQELCKEIYELCPSIDDVITIPDGHRWQGADQFSQFLKDVKRAAPDLLLNSVYSLHGISDIPNLDFIPRRIAMRQSAVTRYTDIVETPRGCLPETERHKAFLKGLGIHNCPSIDPVMWLDQADHGFADEIFSKYELVPQNTIAIFVGSRLGIKQYFQWGKALSGVCQERDFKVIALGDKEDFELSQWQLEIIKRPAINLCGNTTLRQAAAILGKCRLAAGTDTSLAHMACAMETDNVVVLGGGHFGRFFPYSSRTIVVCSPMGCYGCEWRCQYRRPKCIQDIAPEFIEMAINQALDCKAAKPRVFAQTQDSSFPQGQAPLWLPNSQGNHIANIQITYLPRHETTGPSVTCRGESGATDNRQFDDKPDTPDGPVLVSAIVSTYNSEKFIEGCLEDLEAQTIADQLEIIVIDTGSQQNEGSIVKKFQSRYANIRYIRTEERESVYAAWNRGIKFASGKYLTNANTDDRHRRDALEQMVTVMESEPGIDLVYADVIKTRTPNETYDQCTPIGMLRWHDWDRQALLEKGCFIGPQPVWRRKVHDTYGYFNTDYAISADYEFWLRISQTSTFFHIRTPLGLYLDRPDSIEHGNHERKLREDREISHHYRQAAINGDNVGLAMNSHDPENPCIQDNVDDKAGGSCKRNHDDEMKTALIAQGGPRMYSPESILNAIRSLSTGEHHHTTCWFLDKLIDDYPDLAEAHSERAQIAYIQNDMRSAQKHYELAAELSPDDFDTLKNLGDFRYAVQKDGQHALRLYDRALALNPNHIKTLIQAGHVAVSLHLFDKARQLYSSVLSIDPDREEIRRYLDKLQSMSGPTHKQPQSVQDLYAAAQEKSANGDHQGAISLLDALIQRDPGNALAHNDIGVLFYEQGKKDQARDHYQQATMLKPENIVFQKNLADLYWSDYGDAQAAMERYLAALKIDPQDLESLLGCSRICMQMGKNEDAGAFLKCILEHEPWHQEALQLMDRIETQGRREQGAITPKPISLPAQTHSAAERLNSGIDDLLEVLTHSPEDAKALNDLGVLYFENGEKEKALECYEQAVKLQPDQPNFVKNLADYYLMEQGRIKDALKLYVRVLEMNPEDIDCLSCTGLICAAMHKPDDARHFYQRALDIEPWNQTVREAMEKLGDDQKSVIRDFDFKIATA